MSPSIDSWVMEIIPGVFIPTIIIILIIDIPLLIGILKSKSSRRQLSNVAIVNFIFVSFLAVGWMSANVHYGLVQYDVDELPFNCDILDMAARILRIVAAVTLLTVVVSKLIEVLLAPYSTLSDNDQANKMASKVRQLFTWLCILLPWTYSLVINISIVNYSAPVDMHDCYINISYVETHASFRMGYFLPAGIAMVVCILCLVATCMLPKGIKRPSVLPYVLAVMVAFGSSFAWFYYYLTKCEDYTDSGYPGCFLGAEDKRIYESPSKLVYGLSFLFFSLILLFSRPIRKIYCSAWAPVGGACQACNDGTYADSEPDEAEPKRKYAKEPKTNMVYVKDEDVPDVAVKGHYSAYNAPVPAFLDNIDNQPWVEKRRIPVDWHPVKRY